MTEQRHAGTVRRLVFQLERPAEHRRDPEHREEVHGHRRRGDLLWFGAAQVRLVGRRDGRDLLERRRMFAPIEEVGHRDRHVHPLAGGAAGEWARLLYGHQPVRIRIRKRLEQQGVDYRKDRRVGADAERQGQHDRGGESDVFLQRPRRVAQVLEHALAPEDCVEEFHDDATRLAKSGSMARASLWSLS
jgi:hypothetical protein